MKPVHTLLFLLALAAGTLCLGLVFPANLQLAGFQIRFFRFADWFSVSAPVVAPVLPGLKKMEEGANRILALSGDSGRQALPDSGSGFSAADSQAVKFAESFFRLDSASGIRYPGGDSTVLYGFFRDLDSARKAEKPVRILHFGDSQIEGDRISAYLRQRLQQQFGGCGPGLVPFYEDEPSRMALKISGNPRLEKFSLLGKGRPGPHRLYGFSHQFLRSIPDTAHYGKNTDFEVRYRLTGVSGYRKSAFFERATLLFRAPEHQARITWSGGETPVPARYYSASDSLRLEVFTPARPQKQLSMGWSSGPGAEFLGLCLDGKSGVAVDNLPLRGSSGLEFHRIKSGFLQEQIRRLNGRLIILQFGVNVVPYQSTGYQWYETSLVRIIGMLKQSAPGVQVLVLGVSDMARKADGMWQSYPSIPAVKQAQINACRQTGSAFWDVQQAMGGPNSILAWAGTDPPLAGADYIHLSPGGARVLGEMFYQALMREYNRYQGRRSGTLPL